MRRLIQFAQPFGLIRHSLIQQSMILLLSGLVWANGTHSILWKTSENLTDFISLQFTIKQANDNSNFNLISTQGRRLKISAFINRGFIFLLCVMNFSQIPLQLDNFYYHDEAIHSFQNSILTYIYPQAFQFNRTYKLALIRSETSSPQLKNISLHSYSQNQGWTFHLSMQIKELEKSENEFGSVIQSTIYNSMEVMNRTLFHIDINNLVSINNRLKYLTQVSRVQIQSGVPNHYPIQYLNQDGLFTMKYGGQLLPQIKNVVQELTPRSSLKNSGFKVLFNEISYTKQGYIISWNLLQGSSPQLVIRAQHGGSIIFWQINQAVRSITGKKQGGKGLLTLILYDVFGQKVQKKFD